VLDSKNHSGLLLGKDNFRQFILIAYVLFNLTNSKVLKEKIFMGLFELNLA